MIGGDTQRGSLLITAIALIVIMAFMASATTYLMSGSLRANLDHADETQCFYIAESGLARGIREWLLNPAYTGETATPFAGGSFTVTVATTDFSGAPLPAGQRRISSTGILAASGSSPFRRTTEAIVQQPSTEIGWVVGLQGRVWQWDGAQWVSGNSPTNADLNAVHCVSDVDCWAVGAGGTSLHWNGTNWNTAASGTGRDLMGVACAVSVTTRCYAVGTNGTIRLWNGASWSAVSAPAGNNDLMSVTCPTAACYAVGTNSTILRYNPSTSTWINESTGNRDLLGIACTSATDCWAVGVSWGNRFYILRRTASGWQDASLTSAQRDDLHSISCLSAGHCFAVGVGGVMLESSGLTWSIATSGVTTDLNGIWCSATAAECWAVGNRVTGGGRGRRGRRGASRATVQRWQNSPWAAETTGLTRRTTDLHAVSFSPSGSGGAAAVLAWHDLVN